MNYSNVAIYKKYSILIQSSLLCVNILNILCIYTLKFPVEIPIWTVVALPFIEYRILIQRSLLNVNIVNTYCICTPIIPFKLQYEPY
jgi:hypothetical protein